MSAKEGKQSSLVENLRGAKAGGFEYGHYDVNGKLLWTVSSKGSTFEQDLSLRLNDPVLSVIDVSGNAELRATGALIKREEQWVQMSGNVRVSNFHGIELSSGQLIFDIKNKLLTFNHHFVLKRDLMRIEGQAGYYDGDKGILCVEGHSLTEVWP